MAPLLSSFDIDVPSIRAEEYYIDPQPLDDWKQLDEYESAVSRRVSGEAYRYKDGGTWYLLLVGESRPPSTFELEGGTKATWEQTRELSFTNKRHEEIIQRALHDNLSKYLTQYLDYWERGNSQEFYEKHPEETVGEYDAYHGYKTRIEYRDGFSLVVDPKVKFISTYSIQDLADDPGISDNYFEREYVDRYCTLMSEDRPSVRLVGISEDVTVSDKSMTIDDERKSVLEYLAENTHRYPQEIINKVDEDEPIAKVKFPWSDTPVNSAPSLLHPLPNDMTDSMTGYATMNPEERWESAKGFIQNVNYIDIYGQKCDVASDPKTDTVGVLDYPSLQFGGDTILSLDENNTDLDEEVTRAGWERAIDSALKSHGAAKKPRGAPEVGVFHPEGQQDIALTAYDELKDRIRENTGFRLPERPGRVNYEDKAKLSDWISRYGDDADGVFILLRDESDYDDLRADLEGLPAQALTIENYQGTSGNRLDDILVNTGFGLAAKLGVRPILLADGLSSDLYIGLSVSGDQVNTAAAVGISGPDGQLVYQTNTNIAAGQSTVTEQAIAKQVLRQGVSTANGRISEEIRSITIHRNGQFGDGELDGIEEGIDRLIGSEVLPPDVEWEAVEITNNSPHRLYDPSARRHSCVTGTYAVLDDRNGVVATYGSPHIHQGTPDPIHCSIKQGHGLNQTRDVLSDVLALSFLNWGAPTMKTKEPITTHLPEQMHDILATGARIEYPPF